MSDDNWPLKLMGASVLKFADEGVRTYSIYAVNAREENLHRDDAIVSAADSFPTRTTQGSDPSYPIWWEVFLILYSCMILQTLVEMPIIYN